MPTPKLTRSNWFMKVTVANENGSERNVTCLEMDGKSQPEALGEALRYIQKTIASMEPGEWICPRILFQETDGIYKPFRLRATISDKQLLRRKDPLKCFVEGWGPKAHKEIYGR